MIKTVFGMRGHGKTTLSGSLLAERQTPAIVVDLFNQFDKVRGVRFTDPRALLRHLIKEGGAKITRPLFISIFEREDFSFLCQVVREHQNLLFIVDEVDNFDNPHSQEREFKKLIHYGRHYKVDMVTTSRRPANVSRDLTSQTELFYIFRVIESRDLAYFEEINGQLPAMISSLQKFHYLKYDLEQITRHQTKAR